MTPLAPLLVSLLTILGLLTSAVVSSTTFTFENNCDYKVWPAIINNAAGPQLPTTGFALEKGETKNLPAPTSWGGRFWGRTLCSNHSAGNFSCVTGDCGSGKITCSGSGSAPPATRAEFSLDGFGGTDFFDVSVVDGYNLPMLVVPEGGNGTNCANTGCVVDLNNCPDELKVTTADGGGEVVACQSACAAFGVPQYCCSGAYTTPETCKPTLYSQLFKKACPRAYSYAFDDKTSTFTCAGADYTITFCPPQSTGYVPAQQPTPEVLSPTPPKGRRRSKHSFIIATVVVALIVAFVVLVALRYCLLRRRARKKNNAALKEANDMRAAESLQFDLGTIETATNKFSDDNKLGEGGFGAVFKGMLSNGQDIAVKRLSKTSGQGVQEFKNEVVLVAKLQHRNLVRLLGFCLEGEETLLVYEYVPNKSLDYFLFDHKKREQLNWVTRTMIIGGIARGILYLHEDSRLRVIHRDLKASNILLDEKMNSKISDFGMARMFGVDDQTQGNTRRIVGTYGYMAPEYAMEGLYSVKSDVFSFGVLLLEIVTGRRNFLGYHPTNHAPTLIGYAWQLWNERKGIELMDPLLKDSCSPNEFLRYIHIGLLCVQEDANNRPNMSSVVHMLKTENISLPRPEKPAFFTGRPIDQHDQASAENCSANRLTISIDVPR